MTTLWSSFHKYVAPDVRGCPIPVIDHHLVQACRDFCARTGAWREWVDAFTADGTTNRFDYDLLGQQELVKVARAIRNEGLTANDKLVVVAGGALPDDWESGTSTDRFGQDTLVHYDDEQFMVFPLPAAGDTIRLEMVFQPTLAATGVGDVIFDKFANHVAKGAKATLLAMPRWDWTDLVQAGRYSHEFEMAVHEAANQSFARTERGQRRTQRTVLR